MSEHTGEIVELRDAMYEALMDRQIGWLPYDTGPTFNHAQHLYDIRCAVCSMGKNPEARLAVIDVLAEVVTQLGLS